MHQNVIPRTSPEGIQWDKAGNMYFVDELNGGSLYKYPPAAKFSHVLSGRADYFAAGQTFVLRVGDGHTPNAVGSYVWVPITDANGAALPTALTITDPNGVVSLDARNTVNLPAFKGTDYQRPEDLQIRTVHGREYLYVTTTTTNVTYRLDLGRQVISVFADRNTIDLATGVAVGADLGRAPGTSATRSVKFRPLSGSASIVLVLTRLVMSDVVVSSTEAVPVTLTASVTVAGPSARSTVVCWLIATSMAWRVTGLNPASSTVRSYTPGGSSGKR